MENDFEKINKELLIYEIDSTLYKECEFRMNKVKKELDYNIIKLNETIEQMMN